MTRVLPDLSAGYCGSWPPLPVVQRDFLRLDDAAGRMLLSAPGPVPRGTPPVYFETDAAGQYPPLAPKWIIKAVARAWQCTAAEILGSSRVKSIAAARRHAAVLIRSYHPHMSLPQIGRALGGKDHTSILYMLRRFHELAAADPEEST